MKTCSIKKPSTKKKLYEVHVYYTTFVTKTVKAASEEEAIEAARELAKNEDMSTHEIFENIDEWDDHHCAHTIK